MTRRTTSEQAQDPGTGDDQVANQVVLRGEIRRDAERRELPSGAALVTVRLVVPRAETAGAGRRTSDWVDCAVWTARLQRRVGTWRAGDRVEVRGRCGGGSTASAPAPRAPASRSRCWAAGCCSAPGDREPVAGWCRGATIRTC